MIDKQEFYYGVALLRIINCDFFDEIKKDKYGFLIRKNRYVFIKYSTKSQTPWRFHFTESEIVYIKKMRTQHKVFIALVCGGDGICALDWVTASNLMGNDTGWISAARKHGHQYSVAGSDKKMKAKISLKEWPNIII